GQDFTFRLCTRPLRLGADVTVRYYWMDSSGFRVARGRRGGDPANLRNCVGHWWAAVRPDGAGDDPALMRTALCATSPAPLSRSTALQPVYRAAHLMPAATAPRDRSLREPVSDLIREVVRSRDAGRVREALDELLGWHDVTTDQAVLTALTLE